MMKQPDVQGDKQHAAEGDPKASPPYAGKILRVNLATCQTSIEPTTRYTRLFLGGRGINQWLLYNEVPATTPPLGSKNKLFIGAGALVGTSAPCACRVSIDSLSPYTNGAGSANAGGHFGPAMKYAGYDHLILEGKARAPVYLFIRDGLVEIRDATPIWGLPVSAAREWLQTKHPHPFLETIIIGPAGENQMRTASVVVSGGRAGGRCGLGAVIGSKNVKAVVVQGTGSIHVANPEAFNALVERLWRRLLANPKIQNSRQSMTVNTVQFGNAQRELPVHNALNDHLPDDVAERFTFNHLKEQFVTRRLACFGCRIGCSAWLRVPAALERNLPEMMGEGILVNTISNFGARLGFTDLGDIVRAHLLCTELGLDIDAASNVIAWAIECWDRGLLTEEDTEGIELAWNRPDTVFRLLSMMARRKGVGDLLADGAVKAADRLGRGSKAYAMHTKGQDLYEGCRVRRGWSLGVAVDQRGGSHLRGTPVIENTKLTEADSLRVFGVPTANDPETWRGKAEIVVFYEDFKGIIDSVNLCYFSTVWQSIQEPLPIGYADLAELLSAATGRQVTDTELRITGSRIHHVEKAINVRVGLRRSHDSLPDRYFHPAPQNPEGPYLDKQGFEEALTRYYEIRGWNPATGIPPPSVYRSLDLPSIAKDLEALR